MTTLTGTGLSVEFKFVRRKAQRYTLNNKQNRKYWIFLYCYLLIMTNAFDLWIKNKSYRKIMLLKGKVFEIDWYKRQSQAWGNSECIICHKGTKQFQNKVSSWEAWNNNGRNVSQMRPC